MSTQNSKGVIEPLVAGVPYEIRPHVPDRLVYRHPYEDKSFGPKPIFALSPRVLPLGDVSRGHLIRSVLSHPRFCDAVESVGLIGTINV